jgi:hypothetical protein
MIPILPIYHSCPPLADTAGVIIPDVFAWRCGWDAVDQYHLASCVASKRGSHLDTSSAKATWFVFFFIVLLANPCLGDIGTVVAYSYQLA